MSRKKLDHVTEISINLTSQAGYPIYDLMEPSTAKDARGQSMSHYVSATGTVFYTEDPAILKEFSKIPDVQSQKDFMLAHPQCLMNESHVKAMDYKAALAFGHLKDTKSYSTMLKNKSYGCAHLVKEDKLLLFYQNSQALDRAYGAQVDLTNGHEFKTASLKLLEQFEAGKIAPDAEIAGAAFLKIQPLLSRSVHIGKLEKPHGLKKEIETLIGFSNHFNVPLGLDYKNENEVRITTGEKIHLLFKDSDNKRLLIGNPEAVEMVSHITLSDLLKMLHAQCNNQKIDNFVNQNMPQKARM